MGFLDDIGKSLNKVGKKTSDMASGAKLKLDITKLKSNIDKKYEELGSRVYFLAKENIEKDESIDTLIQEIDALFAEIKTIEAEIEKLNAEVEKPEVVKVQETICTNCGAEIKEDSKFCGSCGAKVEDVEEVIEELEEVVEEVENICPNCGTNVGTAKFCNSCGTSIE